MGAATSLRKGGIKNSAEAVPLGSCHTGGLLPSAGKHQSLPLISQAEPGFTARQKFQAPVLGELAVLGEPDTAGEEGTDSVNSCGRRVAMLAGENKQEHPVWVLLS